jgi:predicted DNA-binding transcriptional regulator YafY
MTRDTDRYTRTVRRDLEALKDAGWPIQRSQ